MKISYNWLKEYINCDLTPQQIADVLTDIGLEVEALEEVEAVRGGLKGLVVAEVLTCERHPDADKLSVTTVNSGSEILQVVCGAPNVASGQKVILATVGTMLYPSDGSDGFKIKKSKIRGLESVGMLCAEDEIGVGVSHDGIMVLPSDAVVGTPAIEMFDFENDTILEIGLTPNRVDAASHYGVARDLAAYFASKGESVTASLADVSDFAVSNNDRPVEVVVENTSSAPRYMGVTVTGLTVAPSPDWLKQRLISIGINPKNNLVDITNFVLHECGQPLHAFDLAKVSGDKIVVRNCAEGTKFTTLDGVERSLSSEDLMICDGDKPMCLAGVFGGEDSGVSDSTTEVFIESAYFNPVSIRKSAKRHGLSTDASFRYERGADPNIAPYALMRCASLMCELAGGVVSSEVVDLYSEPVLPFTFAFDPQRVNRLIGKELPLELMENILRGLQIEITSHEDGIWQLAVPAYRVDVQREVDVVEDILRIYGYNNIENPSSVKCSISYDNRPTTERLVGMVSEVLTSMGSTEIMSNSLTRSAYYTDLSSYPLERSVRIINPLSGDLDVMRQTLLFNSLEAMQLNMARRSFDLCFYEVGKCYWMDGCKADGLKAYREEQRLAIALTGSQMAQSWNGKSEASNFYTLKSLVERLLDRLGVSLYEGSWNALDSDLYSEGAQYVMRGSKLFEIGVVRSKICSSFDVKAAVYYFEMNLEKLQKVVSTVSVRVSELNKFQIVRRDLALLVDESVTFAKLREAAFRAEKKLLRSVSLFDVYQGDRLPLGKKSYALGFVLEDSTRTLTDKDIERSMANISAALFKNTGAEIRG
ncbi:MAG: phenylalanine--tRNA ligase subunit beta [Rikenellaceae bacterium]